MTQPPAAEKMPDAEAEKMLWLVALCAWNNVPLDNEAMKKYTEENWVGGLPSIQGWKRVAAALSEYLPRSDLAPSERVSKAFFEGYRQETTEIITAIQAEREALQAKVKELEAEVGCLQSPVDYPDYPNEAYWELAEQATRYRRALEKYADENNWSNLAPTRGGQAIRGHEFLISGGPQIAREALSQTQEGE